MVEFYSTIILGLKSLTHQLSPQGRQPFSPPLAKSVQVPISQAGDTGYLALNPTHMQLAVPPLPPPLEPNLYQSQFPWTALKFINPGSPSPPPLAAGGVHGAHRAGLKHYHVEDWLICHLDSYTSIFLFKSQLHCLLLLTTIPKRCEL